MNTENNVLKEAVQIILKGVDSGSTRDEIENKIKDAKIKGKELRVKLGLDPSAPDIHLGHAVVLRKIRQLQDLGHKAIIIIGDFTGMIGDPTGKSKTRKQLSKEEVKKNSNTYIEQLFKILDKEKTEIRYNSEWLEKMNFKDIISLASKCTVARMLERDDFYKRYTNHLPLSIHEFFYPLMQAYDSVAIKADIELGGTDQTFNILMGRNIQKNYEMEPQLTLFMPLLEGIDGIEKMSKSLGNYIGINENPISIYEKVMRIPDNLIIKYYNLCTDLHPNEILEIKNRLESGLNPRDEKMGLAYEITKLYSNEDLAVEAQNRFKYVFQERMIPADSTLIKIEVKRSFTEKEIGELVLAKLVEYKYYKSKSEIRRIFQQGGARINDKKIEAIEEMYAGEQEFILRLGKRNFYKILIEYIN